MSTTTGIRWENGLKFLERLQERHYLKDLEPALFPEGKFQPGTAVEICGKSGIGKSELLLNLIAKCLLPISCTIVVDDAPVNIPLQGLQSCVIYVDNDHHFSMLRLATIMHAKISKAFDESSIDVDAARSIEDVDEFRSRTCEAALKNLRLMRCTGGTQLVVNLYHLEDITIHEQPFSVLVVDSISAFYWEDRMIFGNCKALWDHHRRMCDVLRRLVDTHKVTVFCTNQDLMKRKPGGQMPQPVRFQGLGPAAHSSRAADDVGEIINSAMGKDFQALWDWKLRLTRSDIPCATNRVVVEVRNRDGLIQKTTFDIAEEGIIYA